MSEGEEPDQAGSEFAEAKRRAEVEAGLVRNLLWSSGGIAAGCLLACVGFALAGMDSSAPNGRSSEFARSCIGVAGFGGFVAAVEFLCWVINFCSWLGVKWHHWRSDRRRVEEGG